MYFLIWRSITSAHYIITASIAMWEKKHTIFTHMMNYTIQHHCFAHRNDCHTEKLNHFSLSKSYHIENIFNVKHLSQKNCHFFDLANRFSIHSPLKSYGSKLADQNTHNKNLMKEKISFPYSLDSCFQLILKRSHGIQVSLKQSPINRSHQYNRHRMRMKCIRAHTHRPHTQSTVSVSVQENGI